MRLLGIDFETTGLDTAKDRIVEIGAVLWEVEKKKPLMTLNFFMRDQSFPIMPAEITKINGITEEMLIEFGECPAQVFHYINNFCRTHKVDYLVAHNAENFDRAILTAELARYAGIYTLLKETPWIDTRTDIPFPIEPVSRRLNHLASDHGFINPFQHRAVFDVLTMLRILSQYDFNGVLEYQKIPFVTVQALVDYDNRHLAKEARFSWENIGDKKYPRMWVKRIKKTLLDQERASYKFLMRELQ
jgi:DNA polymerase III subunit epsilon